VATRHWWCCSHSDSETILGVVAVKAWMLLVTAIVEGLVP
jgi:hypothetical protein